jgi:hypothetical protein
MLKLDYSMVVLGPLKMRYVIGVIINPGLPFGIMQGHVAQQPPSTSSGQSPIPGKLTDGIKKFTIFLRIGNKGVGSTNKWWRRWIKISIA